jgi:hypothetical protein
MGDRYNDKAYDPSPYQKGSTQPPPHGPAAATSNLGGRTLYPPSHNVDGETAPFGGARPVQNESDYGQGTVRSYGRSAPGKGSYGQPRPSYGGTPEPPPPYGGGSGLQPPLPYVTLPDSPGHESAEPQSGYGGESHPLKPYLPYGIQQPELGQANPELGYSGGRGLQPPPYENQEAGRGGGKPQLPQAYPPYGIQHPNQDSFSSGSLGQGRGGGGSGSQLAPAEEPYGRGYGRAQDGFSSGGLGRGRGGGGGSQLASAEDPYGRSYGRGQNPAEYAPIRPSSFEEEEVPPAPISSEVAHETYSSVFADPVYGGARDYNPEGGYSEEPESSRLAHYQQDLHRQNDLK